MDSRRVAWVFTLNNPTGDYSKVLTLGSVRYAIWQQEFKTCHHLQGYVQLTVRKSLAFMKELIPRAHWEQAKGSLEDNQKYCTKFDTRVPDTESYTIGVPMRQGERTDLYVPQQMIKDGASDEELAEYDFKAWMRNRHAYRDYRSIIMGKRDWVTRVIVLTGYTGVGKSWYCHTHSVKAYRQTNKQWFGGYCGQDDVIFDDFYGSRFPHAYLLLLLDRYDMKVETKGGEIEFIPRTIWITSNAKPEDWYSSINFDALERRITYHKHIEQGEDREEWTAEVDDAIAFLNSQEE